jgi:hypothetical protein
MLSMPCDGDIEKLVRIESETMRVGEALSNLRQLSYQRPCPTHDASGVSFSQPPKVFPRAPYSTLMASNVLEACRIQRESQQTQPD